jgi:tuftelin-interacting protein 11
LTQLFSEEDIKYLINQSILPQLINHLRNVFVLNPKNQNIIPIIQVLEWRELIPIHLFSHLFETEFFTVFHHSLWSWLSAPEANLTEITNWYKSWKQLFESHGLAKLDSVKQGFRTALDMMNQGTLGVRPSKFIPTKPQTEKKLLEEPSLGDLTFRDYVELLCSESNVEFVPTAKRNKNGKDLYRLGKLLVYLEDGVLFVQDGKGGYLFLSVEDAIEKSLSD